MLEGYREGYFKVPVKSNFSQNPLARTIREPRSLVEFMSHLLEAVL